MKREETVRAMPSPIQFGFSFILSSGTYYGKETHSNANRNEKSKKNDSMMNLSQLKLNIKPQFEKPFGQCV